MSVKVSLKENAATVKGYPKLMVSNYGVIVLFKKESIGTVVLSDIRYEMLHYCSSWDMSFFKDYDGEVTLKNE